jgi:SAM-dependent methyltransferase
MSDSVSFDRAAEYYDQTRGLSEDGIRRTTDALAAVLDGSGPVLEIGVGTGQVALPLHAAGVELAGIDISRPMLSRLLAKNDGAVPIPLVEGDATTLPFRDGSFVGAYLRWVLHLVPNWPDVLREVSRVVRPGGVFVAGLGSYGGIGSEIQRVFADRTGVSLDPVGLDWDGWDALEREMTALGATRDPDLVFTEVAREDLESFMRSMEANHYSWTWAVTDDDLRLDAVAEARRWAEERFGPLHEIPRESFEVRFAVFRLASIEPAHHSS